MTTTHPKGNAERAQTAFVGFPGYGTHLRTRHESGHIVCTGDRGTRMFLLVGFLAFGPYIWWLIFRGWATLAKAVPPLGLATLCLLAGIGPALILRHLLRNPRLEIRPGDGRIRLTEGLLFATEVRMILPEEIVALQRLSSVYDDGEGNRSDNYTLAVTLTNGETVALCVSGRREEIDTLGALLQQSTGRPLQAEAYTPGSMELKGRR